MDTTLKPIVLILCTGNSCRSHIAENSGVNWPRLSRNAGLLRVWLAPSRF